MPTPAATPSAPASHTRFIPAIIAGHVSVTGATVGTERSMMLGQDHVLNVSALERPQVDYVALGHIHKHQVLSYNPHVAYSGSLERIDFGEAAAAAGEGVAAPVPYGIDIAPDGGGGHVFVSFREVVRAGLEPLREGQRLRFRLATESRMRMATELAGLPV